MSEKCDDNTFQTDEQVKGQEMGAAATLFFLCFVCIIGYILEALWAGLYPFTIVYYSETVILLSPLALLGLCSLALLFLALGMLKAGYPRSTVLIIALTGISFIILLWLLL